MIIISKDTSKDTYKAFCDNCNAEFGFAVSDIEVIKENSSSWMMPMNNQPVERLTIRCPCCKRQIPAHTLSEFSKVGEVSKKSEEK